MYGHSWRASQTIQLLLYRSSAVERYVYRLPPFFCHYPRASGGSHTLHKVAHLLCVGVLKFAAKVGTLVAALDSHLLVQSIERHFSKWNAFTGCRQQSTPYCGCYNEQGLHLNLLEAMLPQLIRPP